MHIACSRMLRILIADDHELVRSGLRVALERQADWQVVAEAADGQAAVDMAVQTKPDVAVIDHSMPVLNGIEATRQIRGRLPATEVLIFTRHADEMVISDMLGAGARGYILKTDLMGQLIEAIYAHALHKPFFTDKVSETLLKSYLAGPAGGAMILSERERSMVQMIAEGLTNTQMANVFNTSNSIIEKQRDVLMRKLGVKSWAGIVRYAVRNGLVEP